MSISAGAAHSLALKSDGTVLAWGNNASGQLGDNNAPNDSAVPVQVSGLGSGSTVVQLAAGFSHALARKSGGTLVAWGDNGFGQANVPRSSTGGRRLSVVFRVTRE